jgi:hypothetical protein
MDLSQSKLSKTEWENIEIPVSPQEKRILTLLCRGFHDGYVCDNDTLSLFTFIKIEATPENEAYLYNLYFEKRVKEMRGFEGLEGLTFAPVALSSKKNHQPRKIDMMRIENLKAEVTANQKNIIEFFMLDCVEAIFSKASTRSLASRSLYTLIRLRGCHIEKVNKHVAQFAEVAVEHARGIISVRDILWAAEDCLEKNPHLIKYEDLTLFSHQRELFAALRGLNQSRSSNKLVLYTAPTGTGKTLSPLGLSEGYRVIFVCVARHIGLSLAKSAVSMGKHVAFAFGCETASDIRLHNFSAASFIKNRKSGGIFKIDNSVGNKVEIMICDVKSYLVAMHYMLSFHLEEDIVTYWDEPTITMDYEEHELHATIHRNWAENKIGKFVLSCATLPRPCEISATLADFERRFKRGGGGCSELDVVVENKEAENIICIIESYDCKKTISLVGPDGKCVLPHLLFRHYRDALKSVEHCFQQKTLLRYMDLGEIVRFLKLVEPLVAADDARFAVETWFKRIEDIDMLSVKLYYLEILRNLDSKSWPKIHEELRATQRPKYGTTTATTGDGSQPLRKIKSYDSSISNTGPAAAAAATGENQLIKHYSVDCVTDIPKIPSPKATTAATTADGILLTTRDAHTLTDGPTIFLVEDVMKVGKFYIQQSKIPEAVFHAMLERITYNNAIQVKLSSLEKAMEDELGQETEKDKKMEREQFTAQVKRLKDEYSRLIAQISTVHMDRVFVPNTREHQERWLLGDSTDKKIAMKDNAFVPQIEEEHVRRIMTLEVETQMKILLLLGIGVFVKHPSVAYMEIMKTLAYEQRLFLIIASSDYIYGTNYQFCHGFLGKDLENMTQQKTIQAMGRIGRNNIQQDYSVRFRDEALIARLFMPMERNVEAQKMTQLFS